MGSIVLPTPSRPGIHSGQMAMRLGIEVPFWAGPAGADGHRKVQMGAGLLDPCIADEANDLADADSDAGNDILGNRCEMKDTWVNKVPSR